MIDLSRAVASAIEEATQARVRVARQRSPQLRSIEVRQYLSAVANTWFHTHRPICRKSQISGDASLSLDAVDTAYQVILRSTDKFASRSTYLTAFKAAKEGLISFRGATVMTSTENIEVDDTVPDFSPLAADQQMKEILARRWLECTKCIAVGADLAAIVMMGGLLEALFVARANSLADKASLFKQKTTPIDRKTGKSLDLKEWTLAPYIAVGHELGWISHSAKDVAVVLRDYRNYIHPEKERSHGIQLGSADSAMLWQIAKSLSRQLLNASP